MTLIGLRHSAIMLFLEAGHGAGHTLDHLNQAGHIPGKCSDMGGEFTAGEARPAAWVVLLLQGYAHRMHPSEISTPNVSKFYIISLWFTEMPCVEIYGGGGGGGVFYYHFTRNMISYWYLYISRSLQRYNQLIRELIKVSGKSCWTEQSSNGRIRKKAKSKYRKGQMKLYFLNR